MRKHGFKRYIREEMTWVTTADAVPVAKGLKAPPPRKIRLQKLTFLIKMIG